MLFEKLKRLITRPKTSVEAREVPRTIDISFTLENQNGKKSNIQVSDIEDYLEEMFANYDQFVILAPERTVNGNDFIQACRFDNTLSAIMKTSFLPNGQAEEKINVQVGLKEGGMSKLVEIYCSAGECREIFMHFYNTGVVENLECYTPVQRM